MDKTLTIPKNRIMPTLALASISTLSCPGSQQDMLTSLLENGTHSTGSNATWLARALVDYSPEEGDDLYVRTIQRFKSLKSDAHDAAVARSDRDSLLEIKEMLSLTGAQLACVVGASRTALYQWIEESKTMRPRYRARLQTLGKLSGHWVKAVGTPLARCSWISGAQRAQLVDLLTSKTETELAEARMLLEQLAVLKPQPKPRHRSILDIVQDKGWQPMPEHVRQAQWQSRRPSGRINSEPA